jgi:hypothetical protein
MTAPVPIVIDIIAKKSQFSLYIDPKAGDIAMRAFTSSKR